MAQDWGKVLNWAVLAGSFSCGYSKTLAGARTAGEWGGVSRNCLGISLFSCNFRAFLYSPFARASVGFLIAWRPEDSSIAYFAVDTFCDDLVSEITECHQP